jgi:hypothetical protein
MTPLFSPSDPAGALEGAAPATDDAAANTAAAAAILTSLSMQNSQSGGVTHINDAIVGGFQRAPRALTRRGCVSR